jgi:hypothetical protein
MTSWGDQFFHASQEDTTDCLGEPGVSVFDGYAQVVTQMSFPAIV